MVVIVCYQGCKMLQEDQMYNSVVSFAHIHSCFDSSPSSICASFFFSAEQFKSGSQFGRLCTHQNTSYFLCVSLQGVWLEGSRAARGDPDVAASVPIGPVQCRRLPPAPLLWRQQDQVRGIDLRREILAKEKTFTLAWSNSVHRWLTESKRCFCVCEISTVSTRTREHLFAELHSCLCRSSCLALLAELMSVS